MTLKTSIIKLNQPALGLENQKSRDMAPCLPRTSNMLLKKTLNGVVERSTSANTSTDELDRISVVTTEERLRNIQVK